MKQIKKEMLCAVLVPLILLAGCFLMILVSASAPEPFTGHAIESIASETETHPCVMNYSTLCIGSEQVNLSDICGEPETPQPVRVLCVYGGQVYYVGFGRTEGETMEWVICSVEPDTGEIRLRCELPVRHEAMLSVFEGEYSQRNAYYLDGQIVLNDGETVLVYDLEAETARTFEAASFRFPERSVYGEYVGAETVRLYTDGLVQTFTLEEMAEGSEGIAAIYRLKDEKRLGGGSKLENFFHQDCVHVIGDKVYAIGSCADWLGGAFAVILEWDQARGVWRYVTSIYTWDVVTAGRCYLVP